MMVERQIEVVNKLGLHARAAAKLVKLCAGYQSTIKIHNGDNVVDGKSIMGVLMLAAAQGTTLKLVAEGDDAEQAAEDIATLFRNCFDEGE